MSLAAKKPANDMSNYTREQKLRILDDSKRALEREKKRFERETGKSYDGSSTSQSSNTNKEKRQKVTRAMTLLFGLFCITIACVSYLADLRQDEAEMAETEEEQRRQRLKLLAQQVQEGEEAKQNEEQQQQQGTNNSAKVSPESLQYKLLSTVQKINERREMEKAQEKPPTQTLEEYRNSFSGRLFERVESIKEKITSGMKSKKKDGDESSWVIMLE